VMSRALIFASAACFAETALFSCLSRKFGYLSSHLTI
jgi:hypothetical protein